MDSTLQGSTSSTSGLPGGNEWVVHRASPGAHAAVNSIAGAADEAARRARPVVDRVATLAHQAVDTAAGAIAPTANWLTARGESINAAQKKLVEGTCGYVSANPLKALGIAVIAGFLLGRIVRR